MNPKVDDFLAREERWQAEFELMREIILECGLTETYKWKHPCYTFNDSNIVLIHGFKEYCAFSFFNGALLKDNEGILVQATENVQSGRQIRFTNVKDILNARSSITTYLYEAIEVERAGLKFEYKKVQDFEVPEELQEKLDKSPDFKQAFQSLTPGRQKAYLLHFAGAKQSATRINRIEKYKGRIMNGKGINDCVCGLSKRFPTCDGSHKYAKK